MDERGDYDRRQTEGGGFFGLEVGEMKSTEEGFDDLRREKKEERAEFRLLIARAKGTQTERERRTDQQQVAIPRW